MVFAPLLFFSAASCCFYNRIHLVGSGFGMVNRMWRVKCNDTILDRWNPCCTLEKMSFNHKTTRSPCFQTRACFSLTSFMIAGWSDQNFVWWVQGMLRPQNLCFSFFCCQKIWRAGDCERALFSPCSHLSSVTVQNSHTCEGDMMKENNIRTSEANRKTS